MECVDFGWLMNTLSEPESRNESVGEGIPLTHDLPKGLPIVTDAEAAPQPVCHQLVAKPTR